MAEANLEDKNENRRGNGMGRRLGSPPQRPGNTIYPNTGRLRITTITMCSVS